MVDGRINDPVTNGLGDNVLRVLFRVKMQFDADVRERYAGICEGDGPQRGLDNEVPKAEDKKVSAVGEEGGFVGGEGFLECRDVAGSDSCDINLRPRSSLTGFDSP